MNRIQKALVKAGHKDLAKELVEGGDINKEIWDTPLTKQTYDKTRKQLMGDIDTYIKYALKKNMTLTDWRNDAAKIKGYVKLFADYLGATR